MDLIGVTVESHALIGRPGAISYAPDGKVFSVLTLEAAEGRIQAIHAMVNPKTLVRIGKVRTSGR